MSSAKWRPFCPGGDELTGEADWLPAIDVACNPWMCPACASPDSKVHGANMGPIWGQQDPGGPHVGPMNFAIWVPISCAVGSRMAAPGGWACPQQTTMRNPSIFIVAQSKMKNRQTSQGLNGHATFE